MGNEKKKIFVSYTRKDRDWAEWIAECLQKQEGYEVIIQSWDFRPGDNFVLKMDEALQTSEMVVVVLSQAYLKSYYCKAELSAAFAGTDKRLIPVRVDDFKVRGLWAPINYIDLVGTSENDARKLLECIFQKPPRVSAGFPGNKDKADFAGKQADGKMPSKMPVDNLPLKNLLFTGREELLEELYKVFHSKKRLPYHQATVITGMGGIGKSETAKEYAFRRYDEYRYIWWVNADSEASIEEAYRSFVQRINLGLPGDNSEIVLSKVSYWMRENQQWLFIFDNIKDEKTLEKYCSFSLMEGQHVLVTSRNRRFSRCILFEPSVFTENEANEFIEKYTGKPADGYFKELAQRMGYLPLALDLCGAYMKIHGCSYQKYLEWFQKYNLELLTASDENADKKNLKTTWQISFKEIKNSASKQLLYLYAFFAPENISVQWFQQASAVLPDKLRAVVEHDLKYNHAIAELTKYSLVRHHEGFLSIHNLMQEVIRDSLKKEQSKYVLE